MRLIAEVKDDPKVKRLMLAPEDAGCFVFVFDAAEDGPCFADHWCESLTEARNFCRQTYGVAADAWTDIPNAPEGCMEDRIQAVPITKARNR